MIMYNFNTSTLILTLLIIYLTLNTGTLFAQGTSHTIENDQCYSCHKELEILPKGFLEYDIHMQEGLSCAGCHGGDSKVEDEDIAMSTKKGFIGVPSKEQIPQFCGKCHSNIEFMRIYQPRIATDQVKQYNQSVHGELLMKGDNKVADCSSCHTAHGIISSKDPRSSVYPLNVPQTCRKCHSNSVYMKGYKIPTNQYEIYSISVHGKALLEHKDIGAPACNDCHGNHGATPPGIASVTHLCGSCHLNNLEFFRQTRMSKKFEELGIHGCEQCHGYHSVQKASDSFVGIDQASFCITCHEEGDDGYETAKNINQSILKLVSAYDSANAKLLNVKIKGMNDIDIGFLLQEGRQKLIESRTLVHTFDTSRVQERTNEGERIINEAITLADKEVDEFYSRRNGFAIATVVFLFFAVALFLKIRDIEKKNQL